MEKSTEDLQSELTQAQSYDEFYNKNTSEIKFPSAVDYLNIYNLVNISPLLII